MPTEIELAEIDNQVKLKKWYNGRELRHYLQLLEIAETICRSKTAREKAKKAAKGFADHYRRMVMCIVMKPFNPDETDEYSHLEKVFAFGVNRLGRLLEMKNEDFETR